ncbi:energy transducer TonB [Chryseobacterium sp. JUb7]|uniref:energy transducer TonB n=1 Tax=Chryseobacterium sp. JUb7 TaxID=2940599 RepID=UPI002167A492|nr:energy transducer TonB [Chryseobacterium sp. JUb7]MCS3530383.1 hypothetical protein [Chryseobacterium sp. JUb7]
MIKRLLLLFGFLFAGFFNAQFLDAYPEKQDFYEGGLANFYQEAHDYLTKNNSKECDAKEIYQPRFVIAKDSSVKLIKDSDTANISKNKCAYNLSIEIIKNLKKWKPAEVKGLKIGALTEFIFYPKDVMGNYKMGYNAENFVTSAQYPKGYDIFRKDFYNEFMTLFDDYSINGDINLEFYINKEGQISNPRIYPEISDQRFNIEFLRTLSRLKKVWKPALYNNIPIKQKILYPMNFSTRYYER